MAGKKNEVRLCVLGAGGAGKSSLTLRYVQDYFVEFYDPTIEDCYRCQRSVDNEVAILSILDTAGQDNYSAMRDHWMRCCDCFILVFSVTERQSFVQLDEFYQQLLRVKDADPGEVPIVLIANKMDMADVRAVNPCEIQEKAQYMRAPLIEASAKQPFGVTESFEEAVREHRKYNLGKEAAKVKHFPTSSKSRLMALILRLLGWE